MLRRICMYCKKGELTLSDAEANLKTYTCSGCPNITQIERQGGTWQVIINGVAVAGGIATILEYMGIKYDDFVDLFDL